MKEMLLSHIELDEVEEILNKRAKIRFGCWHDYIKIPHYKVLNAIIRENQTRKRNFELIETGKYSIVIIDIDNSYIIYYGINLSLGVKK